MSSIHLMAIGEIADVYDGPHATPKKTEEGPVYLGIDAISDSGILLPKEFAHLSEEDFIRWTKRVTPRPSDIVFSYEATLGRYAMIPDGFRGCLGRRLGIVRVKSAEVNPKWLYYYFLTPAWSKFVTNHTFHGSTVDRISVEEWPTYVIPFPDKETQDRQVAVLSSLDDKIENNKRLMAELEATARLVYDEWFVRFDFPDENGRPYRSSGGTMVWNDELKREIPEGWEVGSLTQFLSIRKESVSPQDMDGNTVEHYSIPSFDEGHYPAFDSPWTIESNKYLVKPDDILYSKLNPKIKRLWDPPCLTGMPVCSTEFIVFVPKQADMRAWCLSILDSESFYAYMAARATSSTGSRSRVDPDVALAYRLPIAPKGLVPLYSQNIQFVHSYFKQLNCEIHELSTLRDWLLPMLMNGQVKVG